MTVLRTWNGRSTRPRSYRSFCSSPDCSGDSVGRLTWRADEDVIAHPTIPPRTTTTRTELGSILDYLSLRIERRNPRYHRRLSVFTLRSRSLSLPTKDRGDSLSTTVVRNDPP